MGLLCNVTNCLSSLAILKICKAKVLDTNTVRICDPQKNLGRYSNMFTILITLEILPFQPYVS